MAITEETRHEMYSRFEQTFGHEVATTLMVPLAETCSSAFMPASETI